jgi:hypothetical protein
MHLIGITFTALSSFPSGLTRLAQPPPLAASSRSAWPTDFAVGVAGMLPSEACDGDFPVSAPIHATAKGLQPGRQWHSAVGVPVGTLILQINSAGFRIAPTGAM